MRYRNVLVTITFLMYFLPQTKSQSRVGFFLGSNCSLYTTSANEPFSPPGLGFQGGISFKTKTTYPLAFRIDLFYAFLTANAKTFIAYPQTVEFHAKYIFSSLYLKPQLQFNFLRNKSLFFTVGVGPRTIFPYGKGERDDGYPYEYDINDYNEMFHPIVMAFSFAIGYQNLQFGPLNGFVELTGSFDAHTFTNNSLYTSKLRATIISADIGFYLGATNKPAPETR